MRTKASSRPSTKRRSWMVSARVFPPRPRRGQRKATVHRGQRPGNGATPVRLKALKGRNQDRKTAEENVQPFHWPSVSKTWSPGSPQGRFAKPCADMCRPLRGERREKAQPSMWQAYGLSSGTAASPRFRSSCGYGREPARPTRAFLGCLSHPCGAECKGTSNLIPPATLKRETAPSSNTP